MARESLDWLFKIISELTVSIILGVLSYAVQFSATMLVMREFLMKKV